MNLLVGLQSSFNTPPIPTNLNYFINLKKTIAPWKTFLPSDYIIRQIVIQVEGSD